MIPKTGIYVAPEDTPATTVLCVGNFGGLEVYLRDRLQVVTAVYVGFQDMSAALFAELKPDVVCSPLLSDQFDSTDLAQLLQAFGFTGRYCAVASGVPRPQLVKHEVRMAAPLVNYELVVCDEVPERLN
ncbi:MAG: hypothetical protein AAGF13_05625 [Pseudomonadota bacterium]